MILETLREQASKAGADKKDRIAIMQPYFFPYIGYWQLIHAVDVFVVGDSVHYIKHGWINRNRIFVRANSRQELQSNINTILGLIEVEGTDGNSLLRDYPDTSR